MNGLTPSSGKRLTRKHREQRAYGLVLATGGLSLAAVVTLALSIVGVLSFGLVVLLVVAAAVAGLLLRRTLSP